MEGVRKKFLIGTLNQFELKTQSKKIAGKGYQEHSKDNHN